ncbi:MAG: hypothetical protein ACR2QW_17540 [bacterium]
MERFPSTIIKSMGSSGAMTTCVPVEFDQSVWESTVFFELGGKECAEDRKIMHASTRAFPVTLEADLIECQTAAVVMLRFEIMTRRDNPLAGEVLIAPGVGNIQFETVENLTQQQSLRFFFSDEKYNVIHSQQIILHDQERLGYKGILDDAVSHDAMIRLTGRYDAVAALKEVTSHYATHVSEAS